ncbi:MAG: PF20097 family protein [Thermoplasmata archaeon]|nr:PF20097 family protein [Thermoplasmata archaeon]
MTAPPREEESNLASMAQALSSGPPCPECGAGMEPGYLSLVGRSPGLIWRDPDPGSGKPGASVESISTVYSELPSLKGFRCPECRRLSLYYGHSGEPLLPFSRGPPAALDGH